MNNQQRYRNFRKYENADGTYSYFIFVDGKKVEVSEEVYSAYAKIGYKMERMELGIKCERFMQEANGKAVRDANGCPVMLPEREVSFEKLIDEDWEFPSSSPSPEDLFFSLEDSDSAELYRCIALLQNDERELIKALFFRGLTEQEYADELGITQQGINKRKRNILKKIKSLWHRGC